MVKLLWKLFKTTGDYRYYMLLKELEFEINGNQKSKRDNN